MPKWLCMFRNRLKRIQCNIMSLHSIVTSSAERQHNHSLKLQIAINANWLTLIYSSQIHFRLVQRLKLYPTVFERLIKHIYFSGFFFFSSAVEQIFADNLMVKLLLWLKHRDRALFIYLHFTIIVIYFCIMDTYPHNNMIVHTL